MGGIAEMSVGTCSVGHVMFASGLHTGPALPLVGHTCMRTCEHAGPADLVGSRPHGRCRDVGCRTRCPSCDGALRPKHRRGPADCLAHLHVDMRASRACRIRRLSPHGWHRGEVGWRTRSRVCDVRVHRSTECGTNVNTVPRIVRQQERSEGVLVSVDYIRSRPPSARMDKHDGGRLMGMRPRREGATGGGRVYGNTMWLVFVRSFPSARVCS